MLLFLKKIYSSGHSKGYKHIKRKQLRLYHLPTTNLKLQLKKLKQAGYTSKGFKENSRLLPAK